MGEFRLIDRIVAKSAECIVDIECMPHQHSVHGMEPILVDGDHLHTTFDRHLLPPSKMILLSMILSCLGFQFGGFRGWAESLAAEQFFKGMQAGSI
jgi:hypothetical protein